MQKFDFYDENDLTDRLTHGALRSDSSFIFLLGSPISAPTNIGDPGIPNVAGVIDLIREEFPLPARLNELEEAIRNSSDNEYQSAFQFLLGRRGQKTANEVIKRAVWKARKKLSHNAQYIPSESTTDDVCKALDSDFEGWILAPGVEAVGHLAAGYPDRFGQTLLTTNFDPLLEVSIARAGSPYFRTVLQRDGNLSHTDGSGCHVIHLHGYWHGADTLHTVRQLNHPRPQLRASLASLIKGKTLLVSGYGGWDDTFTDALMDVALDDSAYPEIIWTFNSKQPVINDRLAAKLAPGLDRGRIGLYAGVDCHTFFPALRNAWLQLESPTPPRYTPPKSNRMTFLVGDLPATNRAPLANPSPIILEGNDEDRPPLIGFCVGRQEELMRLTSSEEKVCVIHGLGGQGKSTLAAKYFSDTQNGKDFDVFVWRDCKEEAERFETQLVRIIEQLSGGVVVGSQIANNRVEVLAELLVHHAGDRKILFVFDNVDHYVDLNTNTFSGAPEILVRNFLKLNSNCRFVFTCRPSIHYPNLPILSQRVEGLSFNAAIELFENRKAKSTHDEIREAHAFTRGHAFWLDLLAAQVARKDPTLKLSSLLDRSASESGEMPLATLQSIWDTLADREKLVLRALAESVKPETDARLGDYLQGKLNFNQLTKAIRSLRVLNLVVFKETARSSDVIELHPLVREFIRHRFARQDRIAFIDAIVSIYMKFMGFHRTELDKRPSFEVLQNWTESAELDLAAGKLDRAFERMSEAAAAFESSAFINEFARVAKMLFREVDWTNTPSPKTFDVVVGTYARILAHFGRFAEVDDILQNFEDSLGAVDARFIHYCDIRCYTEWVKVDLPRAIEWGKRGQDLKLRSGVDTSYSTNHNLALSQRDAGDIDPALTYFLAGRTLDAVTDPDELDEDRGAHHYGNIGRCLHLMDQIDPAIVCYRKSAVLLERGFRHDHVTNQGYVRQWIGELFLARGEPCIAKNFLVAARAKWNLVFPSRAAEVSRKLAESESSLSTCPNLSEDDCERYCVAWIYGREDQFEA